MECDLFLYRCLTIKIVINEFIQRDENGLKMKNFNSNILVQLGQNNNSEIIKYRTNWPEPSIARYFEKNFRIFFSELDCIITHLVQK